MLEIAALIASIAFLLFVLFSIPSLLQIRRTTETLSLTLRTLNESLPAILKNIEAVSARINEATAAVNRQIEDLCESLARLQRTIALLSELGQIVQAGVRVPFLNSLKSLAAVVKGLRVFLSVLSEKK